MAMIMRLLLPRIVVGWRLRTRLLLRVLRLDPRRRFAISKCQLIGFNACVYNVEHAYVYDNLSVVLP